MRHAVVLALVPAPGGGGPSPLVHVAGYVPTSPGAPGAGAARDVGGAPWAGGGGRPT